jgi:hypothetical protein
MTPPKKRSEQYGDQHPWKAFFHILGIIWLVSEALFGYADWTGQTLVGQWSGGGFLGWLCGAGYWLLFAAECAVVIDGSRRLWRPLALWTKDSASRKGLAVAAGFLFAVASLLGLWLMLPPFLILVWVLLGLIALLVLARLSRKKP